ncbi:MAG: hypothetical protein AAB855_00555, partial [Patescibacteria group bacterium]
YARVGMLGTLSRTLNVGMALKSGDLAQALDLCGGSIRAQEILRSCTLESRDGFLVGSTHFETITLRVKNEHMELEKGGAVIVRAPDLVIVTTEAGMPIHNADIARHVGEQLLIITAPGQGYWKEAKARALWNNALV